MSGGPAQPTVVLLHGLGLGAWAMTRLAGALRRDGYRVINRSYPSRRQPIDTLASEWLPRLLTETAARKAAPLHVVTHSMGGIVLRKFLQQEVPPNLGRVVMIAPPNHGTRLVDRIGGWTAFKAFTGVNGRLLGTDAASAPRALGPWTHPAELGVIAGNHSINPVFSRWIADGPNDGKVSVASTRLEGMTAHVVMPHSHTWLAYRGAVARQVCAFLRAGRFTTGSPTAADGAG